jgi:hypothetical protein
MASNDGAVPPGLRDAVERQAAARSLRHAARQVGMSPTGLQKFLSGTVPADATCRKLERWAFARAAAGEPPTGAGAVGALRHLAGALPPRLHVHAVDRLLSVLEAAYEGHPPAWLADARRQLPGHPAP